MNLHFVITNSSRRTSNAASGKSKVSLSLSQSVRHFKAKQCTMRCYRHTVEQKCAMYFYGSIDAQSSGYHRNQTTFNQEPDNNP